MTKPDFHKRSYEEELLDAENIPADDLYRNLYELEVINRYLDGHRVTLAGLKKLIGQNKQAIHLADIGCGGGDTLKAIAIWARKKKIQVRLTGIDLKADCISYAKENCKDFPEISFICDDYRNVFQNSNNISIVHCSLFCHHLNETQITALINDCLQNKSHLLINDLERHPLAYHSIKWITHFFSKSYLVKNDAPLSVLRGFKTSEWFNILKSTRHTTFEIENKWAFRHLITVKYAN